LGWIYGANYGVHRIRLRRGAPPAGRRDDETLQMVIEKMLAFDVMTVPFSYLCSITISTVLMMGAFKLAGADQRAA